MNRAAHRSVAAAAAIAIAIAIEIISCAGPRVGSVRAPPRALVGEQGETVPLATMAARARLTVVIFFSPHCRCFDAHAPRLRALERAYRPRGVQFFLVDSEVGGSIQRDRIEEGARGLSWPLLRDPGARWADAVGADYATDSIVLDDEARVRYHGGIDTDKIFLTTEATPYLRDAIDDLLAGRPPREATTKALGCSLEKW